MVATAVLLLGAGCGSAEPELVTRSVRVYSLPGCAAPESGELSLEALGPFSATNSTSEALPLSGAGRGLRFPANTQAVAAHVSAGEASFIGYGPALSEDIDLVLWPEARACELFTDGSSAGFPGSGGGQALGFAARSGLFLAAGGNDPKSSAVVGALTFDLARGEAHAVDAAARYVLGEPRAFATVSEFGDKLLVAGGEDPIHDVAEEQRLIHDSAEVYDPAARRFELDLVGLREQRTRHAALLLPSGETLLIGGRGAFGTALASLEAVSPATRSSSLAPAFLAFGRIEPVALRLSDGRIFVAGGYDADGHPVSALEWRSADASSTLLVQEGPALPARYDRAFVSMPGGAVLAAGGCEEREPSTSEEAALCQAQCRRGCPPATYDAWWIDREGNASAIDLEIRAPRPILLPGSDGSPWLFVASADGAGGVDSSRTSVYRFNPFDGAFEDQTADFVAPPSTLLPPPVAVAPDHFLWLSADDPPKLVGFRASTRGPLSRDVALVSASHPLDPSWPLHLAPDRPVANRAAYDGKLEFLANGGPLTVFVTDSTFDDVEVEIAFTGNAPALVFAGEQAVSCAWPQANDEGLASATRTGELVRLQRGSASVTCDVPAGPLALGLGSNGQSVVTSLELRRF